MSQVKHHGVSIHYEVTGPADGRSLVLIAGLGEQIGSVEFPDEHCREFVEAGYRVIRIDNRDAGLSIPEPDFAQRDLLATFGAAQSGAPVTLDYTLSDLADDVVAVLDDLGVVQADVLGASMGGMVARWVAIRHPQRVRTLTIVMSGSGTIDQSAEQSQRTLEALLSMTARRERVEAIESSVNAWRMMWGSAFDFDEAWVRARVTYAHDRSYRPEATARGALAVGLSRGLFEAQREIVCPTLIMHGDVDPVFAISEARQVHECIAGSQLWTVEGMGHAMPKELWSEMAERVAALGR